MAWTDDLVAYLITQSAVTSALGSSPARIYWTRWGGEALAFPHVRVSLVDSDNEQYRAFEGPPVETVRNVQFSIFAKSDSDIDTVEEALSSALDYYTGTQGTTVFDCSFTGAQDIADPEEGVYHRAVEFEIHHKPTS